LDRRLGRPKSRSERGGEEKNSQPQPGIELPIIQPVDMFIYNVTINICGIKMEQIF
jgi:hypothetical protein